MLTAPTVIARDASNHCRSLWRRLRSSLRPRSPRSDAALLSEIEDIRDECPAADDLDIDFERMSLWSADEARVYC